MMIFMGNPLTGKGSAFRQAISAFSFDKIISQLIHFSVGFSLNLHYLLPVLLLGHDWTRFTLKGLLAVLRRADNNQDNSELCLSRAQAGCHSSEGLATALPGSQVIGPSLILTHPFSGEICAYFVGLSWQQERTKI